MKKLRFGTGGIPLSTKGKTEQGIEDLRKMGLEHMELEFVRSVNISAEKAPMIKQVAKKHDITLSCHGSYFINLNAQEEKKLEASKKRAFSSAARADECGAFSATFHAAFYMKQDPEKVYQKVKESFKDIIRQLQDHDHKIWLRPETTGKPTQWGDLQETVRLSQEVEQVMPCIDFAHLHARTGGKFNTKEEFEGQLAFVEKELGKQALQEMHIHLTGIEYTQKGERHHLPLDESDMNYKDLLKTLKEFNVKGAVVCESPILEKDALLMQKTYEKC